MNSGLLVAIVLALVAARAVKLHGSWLAPGPLFLCMWSTILAIAALVFYEVPETTQGFLWIAFGCCAFELGALINARTAIADSSRVSVTAPSVRAILLAITVGGLVLLAIILARGGISFQLLSFRAIVQLTVLNRSDKYAGLNPQTRAEWLAYVALYFGTLLGGWLFGDSRRWRDRILGVMPLLVIAIVFLLYGSRFGALYGGVFWIAGYMSAAVRGAPGGNAGSSVLRMGIIAASFVFGLSILTQVVRYGGVGQVGWRPILADAFSYPVAFSIWVSDHPFTAINLTAGARGFAKITSLIGLSLDPLPAIPVGFTSSNIYTVFRDMMEDFGSIGMLIVLACAGRVAQAAYDATTRGNVVAAGVLAGAYACIFSTPAVSIFFYAAPTLALVLFLVYMCTPTLIAKLRDTRRL